MTEEEFKKLWTREAGTQPGLFLDVTSIGDSNATIGQSDKNSDKAA